MKPEQLIAELEAALHQGESHDWRLLAPLVLDALKSMQAELTAAREAAKWVRCVYCDHVCQPAEIMAHISACLSHPLSDANDPEALRGNCKALEMELDELRADAWAMICDATNDQNAAAENRARRDRDFREANRLVEDLRAELVKAGESIRAYERMIDGVAEKASALACEEVKAEFMRRDTIARLQAAEIEALKNELARLTTPRPIEEAPKDGTWIVGLWPEIPDAVPVIACWTNGEWRDETGETFNATHFLPLPVKP